MRPLLIAVLFIASINLSFLPDDKRFVSYIADPAKQNIRCYWKDNNGNIFGSLRNLKIYTEQKGKRLMLTMNGGMYMEDQSPLGLFIEDGVEKRRLNTKTGYGNFYLMPNGVFYITKDNKAGICETKAFRKEGVIYATQSGPMLVINGRIHPSFTEGSKNIQIRNGAGILPDGKVLFAISNTEVSLYDFAKYFLDAGCKNAIFFDGFISRAYIPSKNWKQLDGHFGVIVGVTES